MKKIKSLACLVIATLLGACHGYSSATFSSNTSSETTCYIDPSIGTTISHFDSSNSNESAAFSSTSSETITSISETSSSISSMTSSSFSSSSSFISSSSSSISSESSSSQSISSSSSSHSSPPENVSFYNGYYDELVSWTDGEDLKNQLYAIMRNGYKPLSYTAPNYESNINADHSKYDFEYLDVVYSDVDVFKTQTNRGWQREHAFCASLMCGSTTGEAVKQKGRATDFHNLFAANASANGSRGNKNYGVADTKHERYTKQTTANGEDGYSYDPQNYEPGNKDKGRLARAIFYMATMYKEDEKDLANNLTMKGLRIVEENVNYIPGEEGAFAIGNLSSLLDWSRTYNVDYLEMQHNISVYQDVCSIDGYAQGNRNPFVDYPELVDYVYGDKKDNPGQLKDLLASEYTLGSYERVLDHYAIKEAKREYTYGDQVSSNDYIIVKVYKDFTYEIVDNGYTHSLSNHTFSDGDGKGVTANINIDNNSLSYAINLSPMASCSSGEIIISTDGINKRLKSTDQSVKYGGYDFLLNFETTFDTTSADMTINNIWSDGSDSDVLGVTFGSKRRVLTKLTIKTKDSYTVDAAYAKAFVGNNESTYKLTIMVDETVLLSNKTFLNTDAGRVMGNSVHTPLTGQVTYIFTGSSSLKINSVAFNAIIA